MMLLFRMPMTNHIIIISYIPNLKVVHMMKTHTDILVFLLQRQMANGSRVRNTSISLISFIMAVVVVFFLLQTLNYRMEGKKPQILSQVIR